MLQRLSRIRRRTNRVSNRKREVRRKEPIEFAFENKKEERKCTPFGTRARQLPQNATSHGEEEENGTTGTS